MRFMTKTEIGLILFTVLAVMSIVTFKNYAVTHQESPYVTTLNACNKAHNEFNGASEEECGRLQDATNTEFLCDKEGVSCWLELK